MTLVQYTAEVKSDLLLELPAEAQHLLKPGDKLQVQFDAAQEPTDAQSETEPPGDAKTAAALAFLDARIAEGIAADPETRRRDEEELKEFKHSMNANRAAAGKVLFTHDPSYRIVGSLKRPDCSYL